MTLTVSVRPASSSFFAGEHFLCFITFTNTARPHKSAPSTAADNAGQRVRPGFLRRISPSEDGAQSEAGAPPSESDAATETTSVVGDGSTLVERHRDDGDSADDAADAVKASAASSLVSSAAGSTPARKPSTPIGRSHPHSRKMSIRNDFHLAFPEDPYFAQPPASPTSTVTGSPSLGSGPPATPTRTPSLSSPLFPSGEAASSGTSLSRSMASSSIDDKGATQSRRQSLSSSELRGRLAQAPGSVHIIWSFAQLSGSFQLDESLIKPAEFTALKQRLVDLSAGPSSAGAFGGGDLGHDVHLDVDERVGWGAYLKNALTAPISSPSIHSLGTSSPATGHEWGSPSISSGSRSRHMATASLAVPSGLANGMASPSPSLGPVSPSLSRRRVSHKRTGSTLQDTRERTLLNRNIPTLSTPPSILFVDHILAPGESKTYSFRIPLPQDLPPSFAGRSIQFTYNLTVGVNRSRDGSDHSSAGASNSKSKLFNIPIRLYNNVVLPHGEPAFWDLGNPVIKGRDEGIVQYEQLGPPSTLSSGDLASLQSAKAAPEAHASGSKAVLSPRSSLSATDSKSDRIAELQEYTRALLGLPEDDTASSRGSGEFKPSSASATRPELSARRKSSSNDTSAVEEVESHTCASATDILATNSPKVSYDISKDGGIVAVLTLVRSRYRLGDTVQGVVSMNVKGALTRIVRIAVTLESHEDIESSLSVITPASKAVKATRIVHAEHHESTLDKGRVPFSLSIPSGATPDFKTSAVKLKWTVKLSLLTLASVKNPSTPPAPTKSAPPQGPSTPSLNGSAAPSASNTTSPTSVPQESDTAAGKGAPASSSADPAKRLPPPPHLMASKPDGFALYHSAWRAVRHLAGPGMAAVGHPGMLATNLPPTESVNGGEADKKIGDEDSHGAGTTAGDEGGDEAAITSAPPAPVPAEEVARYADETRLEIVECAVPVRVLPSTTNFAVGDFIFQA